MAALSLFRLVSYRLPSGIVAGLVLAGTCIGGSGEPTVAETPITGRWSERRPFHPGVFSIAAGSQIEAAKRGSPSGKAVDNPLLQAVLRDVASPVFRLPGGDRLNDFDYFKDDVSISDWKRLSDLGGSIPLWGVNATTAPTDHTERFARALETLGANTAYFELGNELYLERWKSQAASARDFLRAAAPHAAILRRHFPHAKLGVPGASFWGVVQEPPAAPFAYRTGDTLHPWLRDILANQDLYDAIVLHLYLTPKEFGPDGLGGRSPDELARWAWARSDAGVVKRIFATVHDQAPKKEIWVTEWAFNATQYISRSTDRRWPVHLTMLAMLYDARFMLNVAYDVPAVTVMTAWTLYSSPAVCVITSKGATTIKYDLYRLLRWARQGADRLARLEIASPPRWHGPSVPAGYESVATDAVDVFGFFRREQLQSAVILNPQAMPLVVEVPGLSSPSANAVALTQSALLPQWGNPANPPLNDWSPPREVRPITVAGGRLSVPPHSITVVHSEAVPGPDAVSPKSLP